MLPIVFQSLLTISKSYCDKRTHLSKYTSDNQSSFGKAEPGRQNKIVKKIKAAMGNSRLRVVGIIIMAGQLKLNNHILIGLG